MLSVVGTVVKLAEVAVQHGIAGTASPNVWLPQQNLFAELICDFYIV
ncbi:MAG: hypothetical protein JOZ57_08560 [Abitibacteriaceae bacterium]|nr:hypothetical protein [Abditibacteriaceae bacterium]